MSHKPLTLIGIEAARYVLSSGDHLNLLIDTKEAYLSKGYNLAVSNYQNQLNADIRAIIQNQPPNQINAQNPFLGLAPDQALSRALFGLCYHHLKWLGKPAFRMDRLLDFQKASMSLLVDQLWATLMAGEIRDGTIAEALLPHWCRTPIMPSIPSPGMEALFKRKLIDLHQHYNASSQPGDIWRRALKHPRALLDTPYDYQEDRMNLPRKWEAFDLFAHLFNARFCRRFLVTVLDSVKNRPFSLLKNQEIITWFASIIYRYRGTAQLLRPETSVLAMDDPQFKDERFFLTHAVLLLDRWAATIGRGGLLSFFFYWCFHYYLMVQNIFMQNFVQQADHFGFEAFSRFERGTGMQAYRARSFAQAQRDYLDNHHLDAIELRVVPKAHPGDYKEFETLFQTTSSGKQLRDFGIIFHVVKKTDRFRTAYQCRSLLVARHHELRREVYTRLRAMLYSRALVDPDLARRYLAIDAANDERFAGPEVFAPAFRLFRDRFLNTNFGNGSEKEIGRPLAIAFHAGESFEHLINGIRYVDESLEFLEMRPGDRIGHGLALGLDVARWHETVGPVVIIGSRGIWLDNVLWMLALLRNSRYPSSVRSYLEMTGEELAQEVYCSGLRDGQGDLRTLPLLLQARSFRSEEPCFTHYSMEPILQKSLDRKKKLFPRAYPLWHHYHFCARCRKGYEEKPFPVLEQDLPPRDDWFKTLALCQELVLEKLYRREIVIECNPTSNLRIASFTRMEEHPIFKWFPPEADLLQPQPPVTVNGDNYCVFQTTLPLEYAYLFSAALKRGYSRKTTLTWLETLRQNGFDYSFL